MSGKISLEIYEGVEANVNAYILFDEESAVLIDCLRNSREATDLARRIKELGKPLTQLLITHGHPDHYLGMDVIRQAFPSVRIVVANELIKNDIVDFSLWMETVGWLEKEPAMKPLSASNPKGFDYHRYIEVLKEPVLSLDNGAVLDLEADYLPAECEHISTVFSRDLNAFFCSDFVYNHVHMWLAIDKKNIEGWKTQLELLTGKLSAQDPVIYPGHGKPGRVKLFQEVKKYITDFERVVGSASSRAQAMEEMISLYPDYSQADFLLLNSVNAVLEK